MREAASRVRAEELRAEKEPIRAWSAVYGLVEPASLIASALSACR